MNENGGDYDSDQNDAHDADKQVACSYAGVDGPSRNDHASAVLGNGGGLRLAEP